MARELARSRIAARTADSEEELAYPARMTAQQVQLKLLDFIVRNPDIAELAESRRHTIDREIAVQSPVDHGAAGEDAGAGFRRQCHRLEIQGNSSHFLQCQRSAIY